MLPGCFYMSSALVKALCLLHQDAWSDGEGHVSLDSQQDYELIEAKQKADGYYLLFKRPFSSCDPRDYLIQVCITRRVCVCLVGWSCCLDGRSDWHDSTQRWRLFFFPRVVLFFSSAFHSFATLSCRNRRFIRPQQPSVRGKGRGLACQTPPRASCVCPEAHRLRGGEEKQMA